MLKRPFLTALDERARIKGSRDPLGVQSIWVSFARHVIGNLTTVSSSVRDFTTHLLGAHFAHEIKSSSSSPLEVFLRWEQLAAYARVAKNNDGAGLRGIEQVTKRIDDGEIRISSGRTWQILSDQKTYGLWGLYTGPASQSWLVHNRPLRPTDEGTRALSEIYLPVLGPVRRKLGEYLESDGKKLELKGDRLDAIARALAPKLQKAERTLYDDHLVRGGPRDTTRGLQSLLADLVVKHAIEDDLTPAKLRAVAKQARASGGIGVDLGERLERIARCDALLAPAANLFGFLLDHDGTAVNTLVTQIAKVWKRGLETTRTIETHELREEIAFATSKDLAEHWVRLAAALGEGDFRMAITEALAINAAVMQARGSAPWITVDGQALRVAFRPEPEPLRPPGELRERLRFPYFLGSLIRVARKVRAAA